MLTLTIQVPPAALREDFNRPVHALKDDAFG